MTSRLLALLASVLAIGAGCSREADRNNPVRVIKMDGSSTVFPIAEAVAEEFMLQQERVRVTVGLSGTGGGFKKLCRGEIDVTNASRPILTEEMEHCRTAGIQYYELPIAFDAITVVVHPKNDWVRSLTLADLNKIWAPAAQGRIKYWNQVRPEWPKQPLMLFGPGADSGTFDYFTEAINHKAKSSRGDYTASEDDNVLVQGVENNKNALGYFGFAYYSAHRERMQAVGIEQADGTAVTPTRETVLSGEYQPLSRPLFIYVNAAAAQRPEVQQFVEFYLTQGGPLADEVGFVPLPEAAAALARKHFAEGRVGTAFGGVPEVGVTIEHILEREATL